MTSPSESLQPLEVSSSPQERFEEYLQTRGLRQTNQRKFLIEAMGKTRDPQMIDNLEELIRGVDTNSAAAAVEAPPDLVDLSVPEALTE